ncbi:MAG TPA: tetratricopeptide repeat protein [Candidatus Polarisedimenticolia bacterium]|nr:tetratricopeptide repeat protein [Candidatus Polarisedimenticolia bacterium]
MIQGIESFVFWGGILALVGWAAWTLSGGFTTEKPREETPFRHGLDALLRGDQDAALQLFTETVEMDSDNLDAYLHIGNILRDRGETPRALRIHRELTVRAGLTPVQERTIREALVLDLIAVGRPAEAIEEAQELRETDKKNRRALELLHLAYESAGDWDHAFETRAELMRTNGGRESGALARYRSAAGETFLRAGKAREAERQFQSALRLEKDHPVALLRLGDICYDRDRKDRAVVFWKGLARTHPHLAHWVLERLETAYFERGRMSEMALAYEELLARNPGDAKLHLALARMHVKKGDLEEAARVLAQTLEIDPASLEARLLLVNVHRRQGDVSRALDQVEGLLRDVHETERFTCSSCGASSEEYWTRCPQCLAWSVA